MSADQRRKHRRTQSTSMLCFDSDRPDLSFRYTALLANAKRGANSMSVFLHQPAASSGSYVGSPFDSQAESEAFAHHLLALGPEGYALDRASREATLARLFGRSGPPGD